MKGTVKHINANRGMVAILTEAGDYSIVELLGDELDIGDEVSWRAHNPLGNDVLENHTSRRRMDVFFQNHHVSVHQLKQQLLY